MTMGDVIAPSAALEIAPAEVAPAEAAPAAFPPGAAVARAAIGFLTLGACAGLGSGAVPTALRSGPSAVLVGAGALLLTGPALVVVHQYLGLRARPIEVLGALGTGFVAGGGLALGLSPLMLFFSATTGLWLPVLVLSGLGCGALGLSRIGLGLLRLERTEASTRPAALALGIGWSALAAAIGLRLALELFGGVR